MILAEMPIWYLRFYEKISQTTSLEECPYTNAIPSKISQNLLFFIVIPSLTLKKI